MNEYVPPPRPKRKIDPSRTPARRPDNTPDDPDRVEIGPTQLAYAEWEAAGLECPDLQAMRAFRHARLTAALVERDLGGILLFDPLNIRYATDSSNMQLWTTHNYVPRAAVHRDGRLRSCCGISRGRPSNILTAFICR